MKFKKNILSSILSGIRVMPSSRTLKFTPSQGKQASRHFAIGLDFGSTALKFLQINLKDGKPHICNFIFEKIPEDILPGSAEWQKKVGEILRNTVQNHKLKGQVVVALPTSLVRMNMITLPKMPLEELGAAVEWDFKQNNSGSLEGFVFDYYMLEAKEESLDEIKVMTISSLKEDVFRYLSVLQESGLSPLAVDINSQAVVCALINSSQINKDEVTLVLEFGCNYCSLNVVINNQVYLARDLAVNGRSLTQAISEQLHVSYEEANSLKQKYGLMGTDSHPEADYDASAASAVNQALWLQLENLIQEIDYTFKFFLHQIIMGPQEFKLSKIILSGGSANLNMFSSYLSSYLGVPVERADPFKGVTFESEAEAQLYSSELNESFDFIAPRLSVAMGLAYWEMNK